MRGRLMQPAEILADIFCYDLRFAALVLKNMVVDANGCWIWFGYKRNGYGSVMIDGKNIYVHRLVMHADDPRTEGLQALHKCDVPSCVNPSHLFPGSQADNILDMNAKGRGKAPPVHRGQSHPNATLSDEQVAEIRAATSQTQRVLAAKYHVSQSTIWRIMRGVTR